MNLHGRYLQIAVDVFVEARYRKNMEEWLMAAATQRSSPGGEERVAATMPMLMSGTWNRNLAEGDEDPATVVGAEVARGACVCRERVAEAVGAAAGDGAREGRPVGARYEDRRERPRPRRRLDGDAPVVADSGHAAAVDEAREALVDEAEDVGVEVEPWRVHWRGREAEARLAGGEVCVRDGFLCFWKRVEMTASFGRRRWVGQHAIRLDLFYIGLAFLGPKCISLVRQINGLKSHEAMNAQCEKDQTISIMSSY
uniref:Uncharacterized protein n=1 Tax=Oryza meridionalis TaxID=40149 RepID=A0A0E0DT67_9ORYZ